MTKRIGLVLACALTAFACGDGGNDGTPGTPDAGTPPAPPALGTQVDRVGRPGAATVLLNPFDTAGSPTDEVLDAYNASANAADWDAAWTSKFAASLPFWDGLFDATCGNQLLATTEGYDALAGLLADDQLYVSTASGTCAVYLGVEANALGLAPNNDCGGRVPGADVVDTTYSLVMAGQFQAAVTDGVPADGSSNGTTFPFLGAPQ